MRVQFHFNQKVRKRWRRLATSLSLPPMTKLRFDPPVRVCPSCGMPSTLATVTEAISAISSLPTPVRMRVHWRLATSILSLAASGELEDIGVARHALVRALLVEGW